MATLWTWHRVEIGLRPRHGQGQETNAANGKDCGQSVEGGHVAVDADPLGWDVELCPEDATTKDW